jgi:hypothetical protein
LPKTPPQLEAICQKLEDAAQGLGDASFATGNIYGSGGGQGQP